MAAGEILESESVLVALHSLRARGIRVPLIVTDPPWNNGQDLEINGAIVAADDPRRDLLWLGFMTPIVAAMHDLLTDDGVLVVLIDAHNLPQLGMLLNERFGAHRRLATITWEREYRWQGERGTVALFALVYGREGAIVPAPVPSEVWPASITGDGLPAAVGDGEYRTAGIIELESLIGPSLRHFGAKPMQLFRTIVERWSSPGDTVLDPFAGCGPIGHAAVLTGRRYVMVERPAVVDVTRARMDAVTALVGG